MMPLHFSGRALTFCRALAFASLIALPAVSSQVFATVISYDVANVGGNTWRYDYTIESNTLGADIEEFTIYFAFGLYENLLVEASPAGWDSIVLQPDPGLPDDGFFDSLAPIGGGIAPGATLAGFSVRFDWLGQGIPGAQFFDVIDPVTFGSLESGRTQSQNAVAEPESLALIGLALLALANQRRKRSSRT